MAVPPVFQPLHERLDEPPLTLHFPFSTFLFLLFKLQQNSGELQIQLIDAL